MSGDSTDLQFYNTLTRSKEAFVPIDPNNVRMYVCGPTVYDFAHIGNARPAIVFDVLYRLLRHVYGPDHVTYARNITDVDDKINARAARDYPDLPVREAIAKVTETTTKQYHQDVAALGCLPPDVEPRATGHIGEMIALIEILIANGHAYEAEGHVLFDVRSWQGEGDGLEYGKLARRSLDDMIAGARVEVAPYKRDPMDFVLWKPSTAEHPGWDSPWGNGRPGWHIECSAMAGKHLGTEFDIHGGGIDLVFPHHENEVAQSRCAHGTDRMARVWMHNGFLQVEGRKMSKSEGNFITINELLRTETFGGRTWPGEVLRLAMLMTHYKEPIDFSIRRLEEAEGALDSMYRKLADRVLAAGGSPDPRVLDALANDLNTPEAIRWLRAEIAELSGGADGAAQLSAIGATASILGLLQSTTTAWFDAKKQSAGIDDDAVAEQIEARLSLIADKNWKEADRIRDALLERGIQLKDGKDPETGARTTTWEVRQ